MMSEKDLQRFIISRFIITSVVVSVVEFIILFSIVNILIPIMTTEFFPQIMRVGSISDFLMLPKDVKRALIVTLAASGILSLLPLAAGAFAFSKGMTKKIRILGLQREKERALYDRRRYLMISDIAHDLKTPMTTVTGFAKALADGMVSEDRTKDYLCAIKEKTLRMNDIVQMLFDYVRLQSEGFELSLEKTDVCELVRECLAGLYQDIEEKNDVLDVDIPETPATVNADKIQLKRVINNLVVNAVRHNEPGTRIGVSVKVEPDEIRVFVSDDGESIKKELADKIFEPFVMGDESRKSSGGSGLGLSVCSTIMKLHKGKIKLEQQPQMQRYRLGDKYSKVFVIILKPCFR